MGAEEDSSDSASASSSDESFSGNEAVDEELDGSPRPSGHRRRSGGNRPPRSWAYSSLGRMRLCEPMDVGAAPAHATYESRFDRGDAALYFDGAASSDDEQREPKKVL